VILSSALFNNFLTLLVVATYCIAPIPNWLCGKASNQDDFTDSGSGNSVVELGRFVTGFLVVMGVGTYCTQYMKDSGDESVSANGCLLQHCR